MLTIVLWCKTHFTLVLRIKIYHIVLCFFIVPKHEKNPNGFMLPIKQNAQLNRNISFLKGFFDVKIVQIFISLTICYMTKRYTADQRMWLTYKFSNLIEAYCLEEKKGMGDAEGFIAGAVKLRLRLWMKCKRRNRSAKPKWSYRHATKAIPDTTGAY